MMRGTHQVAAFAAGLGALVLARPLLVGPAPGTELPALAGAVVAPLGMPDVAGIPWPTATAYVLAALVGGLVPDLDKPKRLWPRLVAGFALGGHRHLSHSLLGLFLATALAYMGLALLTSSSGLALGALWLAFVAGYSSHLILDSFTREGVPWFLPWGGYLGVPPAANLRLSSGGLVEQFVVMPLLLVLIAWLGFAQGHSLASLWR